MYKNKDNGGSLKNRLIFLIFIARNKTLWYIEYIFNEKRFNKKGNGKMTRKEQKENRQKQILFKALELFVIKGYM